MLNCSIGQQHELLIGGRVDIKLDARMHEGCFKLHGLLNGSLADFPVKVIGKESRETQSRKTTFGQKRSALALSREEVARKLLIRDDQGFAAQRAALGAADAEGVRQASVVFKFDVACSKRISKTRAVDIKKESFFAADLGEFLEFGKAISVPSSVGLEM